MEGILGHKGPIWVVLPFLLEGGEACQIGKGFPLPMAGVRGGGLSPLCGAPSSPPNLYILEVLHLFYTQVLDPPLVHLALVLVGPS